MKSNHHFSKLDSTDDTTSIIGSDSTISDATKSTSKSQARVKTLIQTLAAHPTAFGYILDLAQTSTKQSRGVSEYLRDSATMAFQASKVAGQLKGSLTSISHLFMQFGADGMLPGLLHNGILTEIAALNTEQTKAIFEQIFAHELIKQELAKIGINHIDQQALVNSAATITNLIKQASPEQLNQLENDLANLIAIQIKSRNIDAQIVAKRNILNNPKAWTSMRGGRQALESNIAKKESAILTAAEQTAELIPIVRNNLLQMIGTKDMQPALHEVVNNVLSIIPAVIEQHKDAPTIKAALQLQPEAKLSTLIDIGMPTINAVLTHAEDFQNLANIYNTYQETKNPSELIRAGSELLQHENILATIPSVANIKLMASQFTSTDPAQLAQIAITSLQKDGAFEQSRQELQLLLPKILKLPHISKELDITAAQTQALPHIIDYVMDITQASLSSTLLIPMIQTLSTYQNATASAKTAALLESMKAGIALIQEPQISAIATDKTKLNSIAASLLPPELAKTIIDIGCDNKDYLLNIANTALSQSEMPKVIELYQDYSAAKAEERPKKLLTLATSVASLLTHEKMQEAILNPAAINKLVTEAAKQPLLQAMIKEDLSNLQQAANDIAPILFGAISPKAELINILLNDNSKNNLIKTVTDTLTKDGHKIAKIIDLALSATKKDQNSLKNITGEKHAAKTSLALRLLKPLGINGDFIVSLIKDCNTPKGLQAAQKCIEQPNISNVLNLLYTTGTASKIIGHMAYSATKYLLNPVLPKTFSKPLQTSWVEKLNTTSNRRQYSGRY